MSDDGLHNGELLAQRRAGVVDEAQRLAGMLTAPNITDAMSRFIAEREMAFITAADQDGFLWTSPMFGSRGFCEGRGRSLTMTGTVPEGDPLHGLRGGQPAGVLFINFARRRRLRVNGVVCAAGPDRLAMTVEQAFGNCPRHITPRHLRRCVGAPDEPAARPRRSTRLEPEDIAHIVAADTFVLGTIHPERGADTSHRGGPPGFVRCGGGELWWPDYPGNNLFNSMGNIVVNPATSLLFVDFDRGTSAQLSGRSTIEWTSPERPGPDEETGRRIRFTPDLVVYSIAVPSHLRTPDVADDAVVRRPV